LRSRLVEKPDFHNRIVYQTRSMRRGARAAALPWSGEAREALEAILNELAKEGIRPGDRRQFKDRRVVRAFAFLNGAARVEPEYLEWRSTACGTTRTSNPRRWRR